MNQRGSILDRIARILGRPQPLGEPPIPPAIAEPITRLVHTDFGLGDLFATMAQANHMHVTKVYVEELAEQLIAFLRGRNCRTLALPVSPFLQSLGVEPALTEAGFTVRPWNEITLDELYDFDCGITDVWCAVAETGSLVIRACPQHGRALSLVPPIHVAIVQPKDCVGDLLDFFQKLAREGAGSNTTIISGPSKTADIEMNLVEGMHGPGVVAVFLLQ